MPYDVASLPSPIDALVLHLNGAASAHGHTHASRHPIIQPLNPLIVKSPRIGQTHPLRRPRSQSQWYTPLSPRPCSPSSPSLSSSLDLYLSQTPKTSASSPSPPATARFFICLGLSSGQCCNVHPDTGGFGLTSIRVTDGSGVALAYYFIRPASWTGFN